MDQDSTSQDEGVVEGVTVEDPDVIHYEAEGKQSDSRSSLPLRKGHLEIRQNMIITGTGIIGLQYRQLALRIGGKVCLKYRGRM